MDNQSVTVDYRTDALDGDTPAPVVQPGVTTFDVESQIYRPPTQDAVGLIDPDLSEGGSIGPRAISQLMVALGSGVAPVGARVTVVARMDTGLVELAEVLNLEGLSVAYADPFVVPQGASLRLEGVTSAGTLVRLTTDVTDDVCRVEAAIASAAAIA